MRYRTPAALEMAVREAARKSPIDTGRAIDGFYFHRLLCRVFSEPDTPFALKGGHSLLARTTSARATRDIDLLAETTDLDEALEQLKRLAAIDLGDYVSFAFQGAQPIKVDDDYRSGINVSFSAFMGGRRIRDVSIDLVVDEIPCERFEVLCPADRIEVADVPTYDYRVYPAERSLADKLLAMLETHDGRPSSRVKDLVDVLVYMETCNIDGGELSRCVLLESHVRKLSLPERFSVPEAWHKSYSAIFTRLMRQTSLSEDLANLDAAEQHAATLFDPVLSGTCVGKQWDRVTLTWIDVHSRLRARPQEPGGGTEK